MTPPPPAKASLEVGEDTDMRDGENEASAIDNDEGLDTSLLYQIPKIKKPKRIEKSSPQKMEIHIMEEDEEKHAAGYDSDGNCGVHMSEAVKKEWAEAADVDNSDDDAIDTTVLREQLCNTLPPLPGTGTVATAAATTVDKDPAGTTTDNDVVVVPVHVAITDDVLNSKRMKVVQLKKELKNRLQPTTGVRQVLKERLKEALNKKVPYYTDEQLKEYNSKNNNNNNKKNTSDSGLDSFPPGAYWEELKGTIAVDDPSNESFRVARPPTVPEEDAEVPFNQKYNFDLDITVPDFTATATIYELTARGNQILHPRTKEPKMKDVVRENGHVNPAFKTKHKLSKSSRSYEFADTMLPLQSKYSPDGSTARGFSFANLTSWTNTKAILANAGPNGITYRDFVPFDVEELRSHFGIYVLQGLSPSPRVEYKFRRQIEDPVNGNDYVYQSTGKKVNRERRHKHFKAFFSCQDPCRPSYDRDSFPNWKVRPLLQWINYIGPIAWSLGRNISVDEMTMRMKGTHRDILRITYKNEGDGFQSDALCQEGFCYQHFMRNEPPPTKYISKGFSPLHSRVLSLFDSLKDDHHQCGMDNLYNSAKFCRAAYQHERKVLCHGVTRKGMRGIPECVKQEEKKSRKEQIKVRGTVKAAILMGDDRVPCLIASSVYDTKPVHYLSMVSGRIEWIEVKKRVFNVDTNEWGEIKFLRMNFINNYNFTMGHVDVSDQLRGSYRIDRWVRNRKWWWSMMFWGIGVLLTNAYVLYKKVLLEEGVDEKNLLSQYDFRKEICLYWINPTKFAREYDTLPYTPLSTRKRSHTATTANETIATRTSPRGKEARRRMEFSIASPDSTISSLTGLSSPSYTAATVNDASLHIDGKLNRRLDNTCDHTPLLPTANRICQLHYWCGPVNHKMKHKQNLAYCPTCKVTLCLECYKTFHREENLVEKKDELYKQLRKSFNKKKKK